MSALQSVSGATVWAAVLGVSVAAVAATPESACTASMIASDTDYNDSSFTHGAHWSDGKIPGAGSTNYVGEGFKLCNDRDSSGDIPYPGDVLVLAGTFSNQASSKSVVWPELRLQNGALYKFSSFGHIDGKIVVESDASAPAQIVAFYGGNPLNFDVKANFSGEEGTELLMTCEGTKTKDTTIKSYGDWSAFRGKMRVDNNTTFAFGGSQTTFGGTICKGTGSTFSFNSSFTSVGGLELEKNVTLAIPASASSLTLGTLTLADGATLEMSADAAGDVRPVSITNRLASGLANLKLTVASGYAYGTTPPKFEVFRLSADAVAAGSDFSRMYVTFSGTGAPDGAKFARLVAEDDPVGGQIVYVTWPAADFTMNVGNGTAANSAFGPDNAKYWVDGKIPSETSSGTVLCTESLSVLDNKTYWYTNLTFELAAGKGFYNHGCDFRCKEFVLGPGAGIYVYMNRNTTLRGKVTILPGAKPAEFQSWERKKMDFIGELCGSGDLQIRHHAKSGGYNFQISDSSAFSGNLEIGVNATGANCFYFGGDCFGGPYTGSTAWKSVTFMNNVPVVFTSDICMTEPTRGIFIASDITFAKPSAQKSLDLTITESITYNGVLTKNYPGAFVLGGTARFVDGDPATEPVSGKNTLRVKAGTLKVVSAQALNGVQLELSDGVTLLLDPTPQEAAMAATGIVNTRWATPFVSHAASGKVAVKIESDPVFSTAYADFRVAICTVTAAAAENLAFDVDTTDVRRGKVIQGRQANGDGTVTCYLDFVREGFSLIVR